MNILNNMEAVFAAAAALAVSAIFMTASIPSAHAQPVVTKGEMAIIVIKAKRMSAEEKLKSVHAESASAIASDKARHV